MSIDILVNESAASRRCVPIMCFQSNGTSAATNESGRTFTFAIGGAFYGSGGSLSAVSGIDGAYMACFSASKVSVLGPGMVMYSSGTALPWSTPFRVVPFDSYDSMRLGLFALPNAAAEASGGLITHGTGTGQLHTSSGSVGLKAISYSGVTVQGVSNYANISDVTLHAGTHSGATIQGLSNYANISNVTLAAGTHSGATISGVQDTLSIADGLLGRNIAGGSTGGRTVSQALYPLRNRVLIESSVGTVYQVNDTTSSWTFSPSLGTAPLSGIDPTG
jgi:hypothetical protein